MRIALDTNVLAYAEGVNGAQKKAQALQLIERLSSGSVSLPVQTLGELLQLLLRDVRHMFRVRAFRRRCGRLLLCGGLAFLGSRMAGLWSDRLRAR